MGEGPDLSIEHLARRQQGCFTAAQAKRLGFSLAMMRGRVASGHWIRLAPSVFALASAPATWQRQYKAAELSVAGAAIADRAAARLHDLAGFRTVRPEIVVPYGGATRSPLAKVRRSADALTRSVSGVRVTTVAQTLFDVTARTKLDRLEAAIDDAILTKKVRVDELVERLDALSSTRRAGIGVWRALISERSDESWVVPESVLETALFRILRRLPGRPTILRQASLPWWQRGDGRFDTLVPDWRLIVKADGRRWHARARDFDTDRWRDNVAQAHGHRVLRFTYTHLTERPDEVLELIAEVRRWIVRAA